MVQSFIHPTAVVEKTAHLGNNVHIGPYCIVGPHVVLHDNVTLKSHVVLDGHTTIGENSTIYPFSSIGTPPQDLKYKGEPSELIIGRNCTIRENVTMNTGTEGGGMKTVVGDNGLFMVGVHIAHDCQVGNNVIMANNAIIAGHVVVGNNVLIGGMSAVHQFIRIGEYAVIGGCSALDKDVIPFGRVRGERANLEGLNLVGLERGGFEKEQVRALQKVVNELFASEGTMEQRIEMLSETYANDTLIMKVIDFARKKDRFPLCPPSRQAA